MITSLSGAYAKLNSHSPYDTVKQKYKKKDEKGGRKWYDLRCTCNTHIAIQDTSQQLENQSLPKRRRESKGKGGYAGSQEAHEEDLFAPYAARVGDATPEHCREELRGWEAGAQEAGLA